MDTIKELKDALREAITNGSIVEFYYRGGVRQVEPYAYGIHKVSSNEVLSAYQVGGYSRSKKLLRWRLFLLKHIKDLRITSQTFDCANRPHYKSKDSRMSIVFCAKKK